MTMKHTESGGGWFWILGGVILAWGGWLRVWRVWDIQIFGDEIHSLRVISEHSYGWILTNFFHNDACIPYTFYNRLLMDTIGLTELSMRLPEVLAGTVLLGVVVWGARGVVGPWAALVTAGFLALSPLFVFLARDARPYSMAMLLVTAAGLLLAGCGVWKRTGLLSAAAAMLALAVYFLLVVAPGAAVLWLLPAIQGRRSKDQGWLRPYLIATGVGFAVGLATLGPALPSFQHGVASKAAMGNADWETVRNGLLLLHGLPAFLPVWLWLVAGGTGFALGLRRTGVLGWVVLAAVGAQVLSIHLVRPEQYEIPWVWLRYWIFLAPLLLLCIAAGYARILEQRRIRATVAAGVCAVALVLYGAVHLRVNNYATDANSAQPVHPMVMLLNFSPDLVSRAPTAGLYTDFLPTLPADAVLVESPVVYTFPLYGRYTPLHQRRTMSAGAGEGMAQDLVGSESRFRFRTAWPNGAAGIQGRPVYWIHHVALKQELADWLRLIQTDPYAWSQMKKLDYFLEGPLLEQFYGSDAALDAFSPDQGELVYQDASHSVYRLPTHPTPNPPNPPNP